MRIMTFGVSRRVMIQRCRSQRRRLLETKTFEDGLQDDTEESHNGSLENCKIIGLGDYDAVRQIWVNHLKALYNDAEAWETGEDYQ